jgi:hypothetical protein
MPLIADLGTLEGRDSEAQGLGDEKILVTMPERLQKVAD